MLSCTCFHVTFSANSKVGKTDLAEAWDSLSRMAAASADLELIWPCDFAVLWTLPLLPQSREEFQEQCEQGLHCWGDVRNAFRRGQHSPEIASSGLLKIRQSAIF